MSPAAENHSPPWCDGELRSPENGEPLVYEGANLLSDGERLWPVVEGIPYLRVGRDELREEAVSHLEKGDETSALAVLLGDQDDWAPDPPPSLDATRELATGRDTERNAGRHTLRRAMELLDFGRVGDYLIHRPSDPTYLAGLALVNDNLRGVSSAFQLACGLGNYSRELARREVSTTAADVVFAKVWLARRYVSPETRFICMDAAAPFPIPEGTHFDLVLCQDAFYFLPEKPHVAREMSRLAGGEGTVAIGHAHNAAAENLSSGAPLTVPQYAALLESPLLYDDAELTKNLLDSTTPEPQSADSLAGIDALCMVQNRRGPGEGIISLTLPPAGTKLSVNPLYEKVADTGGAPGFVLRWPSERYETEYAPQAKYLPERIEVEPETLYAAEDHGIGASDEVDELARRRILLDVPEGWW